MVTSPVWRHPPTKLSHPYQRRQQKRRPLSRHFALLGISAPRPSRPWNVSAHICRDDGRNNKYGHKPFRHVERRKLAR